MLRRPTGVGWSAWLECNVKITHINDWNGHTVSIHSDIGITGEAKGEVVLTGRGETKHEAAKNGLRAVNDLESRIKEMREKLNAL